MAALRPDSPLLLSYAEFASEITNFKSVASGFLEREAPEILTRAHRELTASAGQIGIPTMWGIPEDTPVRTKLSPSYHRGSTSRNAPALRATMTSAWSITPQSPRDFLLSGLASTLVRIEDVNQREIA